MAVVRSEPASTGGLWGKFAVSETRAHHRPPRDVAPGQPAKIRLLVRYGRSVLPMR